MVGGAGVSDVAGVSGAGLSLSVAAGTAVLEPFMLSASKASNWSFGVATSLAVPAVNFCADDVMAVNKSMAVQRCVLYFLAANSSVFFCSRLSSDFLARLMARFDKVVYDKRLRSLCCHRFFCSWT